MLLKSFKIFISVIYSTVLGILLGSVDRAVKNFHLFKQHPPGPITILLLLRVYVKESLAYHSNSGRF